MYHEDHGGILELGNYVSGKGVFDSDPMIYEGGSDVNCIVPRSSKGYWYCWYDAFDEIVSLDHL
jgi:hypothetical protein